MRKIDIHCHILPEIDDGSSSIQESMRMLRMAVGQGIRAVIATPHYSERYRCVSPTRIRELCTSLEAQARNQITPDFRIYPGQEIFYSDGVMEKLNRGELLTLADSRYVLLEFLPNVAYSYLYRALKEMVLSQYCPILAHAERYGVLRSPGRVEELIETGVFIQMNYRPVGGHWYDETTRWCRAMLKSGRGHFLATDMHNAGERRPSTREAGQWMVKHLDREYIQRVCCRNAQDIVFDHVHRNLQ